MIHSQEGTGGRSCRTPLPPPPTVTVIHRIVGSTPKWHLPPMSNEKFKSVDGYEGWGTGWGRIFLKARERVGGGCVGWEKSDEQLLNAFQVLRYVLRDELEYMSGADIKHLFGCRKKADQHGAGMDLKILVEDEPTARAVEHVLTQSGYELEKKIWR